MQGKAPGLQLVGVSKLEDSHTVLTDFLRACRPEEIQLHSGRSNGQKRTLQTADNVPPRCRKIFARVSFGGACIHIVAHYSVTKRQKLVPHAFV